jgi:ABC-type nickel/cobalt efflux system permease component RcnA
LLVAIALLGTLVAPPQATAHFLAPGVVNQVAQVWFGADYLRVDGSIDFGELQAPVVERIADETGDRDGSVSPEELQAAPPLVCQAWFDAFVIELNGARLSLTGSHAELHPYVDNGSGQLYEVHCSADAEIDGQQIVIGSDFLVRNEYLPTVPGAREYQAVTDIEQVSRSTMITRDPTENTFAFSVVPYVDPALPMPSSSPSPTPPATPTPSTAAGLEALLPALPSSVPADAPGLVVALLFAFLIGAAHALTPGHGKALIGAALMGRRATVGRAALLGLSVSVAHTVGVLLMAVIVALIADPALTGATTRYAPIAAATAMIAIAVWMLGGALREGRDHHHDHEHAIDHRHGADAEPGSVRALLLIGISGGIVPSASALIVLIGAIAAGAAAYGVAVVIAFGAGMAAVMIGVALFATRVGAVIDRPTGVRHAIAHRLPLLSALTVTAIAVGLFLSALAAL